MFPLKVCLVGCAESVLPDLRRELSSLAAGVEGEWPDVRSALAELSHLEPDHHLLIVQLKSPDEALELERLNEILVGQPLLALVDLAKNAEMFIRAMRSGAAQVVRIPLQSEDFQAAMHRIAVQFGSAPTQSKVIAVCGVTEGCGSTTIAINLAAEIAHLSQVSCILVEASFEMGRLAVHLDVKPQTTIYDLMKDPDRVDLGVVRQALTKVSENFSVLVGSYADVTPLHVSLQDILRLHGYVRQLADVIVIDMPYNYDERYFDFLSGVHEVLLVGEQKVSSMYALRTMLNTLARREILATTHVVINRYEAGAADFGTRQIERLLDGHEVITIANDHASVIMAENKGRLLRQEYPHSPVLADIDNLARRVMGQAMEPPPHRTLQAACSELAGWLHLR